MAAHILQHHGLLRQVRTARVPSKLCSQLNDNTPCSGKQDLRAASFQLCVCWWLLPSLPASGPAPRAATAAPSSPAAFSAVGGIRPRVAWERVGRNSCFVP